MWVICVEILDSYGSADMKWKTTKFVYQADNRRCIYL